MTKSCRAALKAARKGDYAKAASLVEYETADYFRVAAMVREIGGEKGYAVFRDAATAARHLKSVSYEEIIVLFCDNASISIEKMGPEKATEAAIRFLWTICRLAGYEHFTHHNPKIAWDPARMTPTGEAVFKQLASRFLFMVKGRGVKEYDEFFMSFTRQATDLLFTVAAKEQMDEKTRILNPEGGGE